ncbi:MAG: hypothetical protein RL531_640 [Actinomycetota bacterium]|jgi:poly(A) polymerase
MGDVNGIPPRLATVFAPDAPTRVVASRLAEAGHRTYLVGGSVRDAFANRDLGDLDLTTSARPDDIERAVGPIAEAVWLQGKAFGTVGARVGGHDLEITTFRGDVYRPESRKPEVAYADDIESDLVRRDFTVNAMAIEVLADPVLVDPHGGLEDLLVHRRLRTPRGPETSFADDPLRMMRAARFIAGFGLEPDEALVAAVEAMRSRLEIVSAERIRDELSKLLQVPDCSAGLWFLARTGLSDEFLPELNAMQLEQDPIHHHKDVLAHTIAVVNNTDPDDLTVRLAALFHDVGKPRTRSFERGGVSFHHHEVVGARMTRERMAALRYPNEMIEDVTQLVYLHLRIHTYAMGWTDKAVRRYVRDAGPLLARLNHLQRCDCTTRNRKRAAALERRMDELERRIEELRAQEELDAIRPPLDGRQVMDHLGVGPSRVIGEALDHLLEIRLDEGPIEEAEAYRRLDAWAAERGITT